MSAIAVPPPPPTPMLFGSLTAVSASTHMAWGINSESNLFPNARLSNAVPIGAQEFVAASQHYPLVFAPAKAGSVPLALTAIAAGRNLFTDSSGTWLAEAHVPLWLQCWPFFLQTESDDAAALWADPHSPRLVRLADDALAQPLFNHLGEPAPALQQQLQMCQHMLQDVQSAQLFGRVLQEQGLLLDASMDMPLPGLSNYRLGGFQTVNLQALAGLPDKVLADWTRIGWIGLISLHVTSMANNWERLRKLHLLRLQESNSVSPTAP